MPLELTILPVTSVATAATPARVVGLSIYFDPMVISWRSTYEVADGRVPEALAEEPSD